MKNNFLSGTRLALAALALSLSGLQMQAQNTLIPQPVHLNVETGNYQFTKLVIRSNDKLADLGYFQKQLESIFPNAVETAKKNFNIQANLVAKKDAREGYYTLKVDKKGLLIEAPTETGIFYGIQTALQLFKEHQADQSIPYLSIEDYPKFQYRGAHLDVGRHFFSLDDIKSYLDYIAALKINKFHWHLTEDQGWRLEIKKYPKLQTIAAYRDGTMIGAFRDYVDGVLMFDNNRYGGYYTQDEAREVVAYAKKLHIDVIPEIEMPGHAQAAVAAYPELGCATEPLKVWQQWGVSKNIFCPGEATFKFLEEVIDEVVDIFPYEYIHIGGDEAPKDQWKTSQLAQDLIKKEGLKDEHELQTYFITRMEKYINSKGRQIIGWDEILEGGLAPNATVMSWRGTDGGIQAAKQKHKAIMTPYQYNYLDYSQGRGNNEPISIGGYLPLKKVYSYNPTEGLTEEEAQYIWGTQSNLWTEYIPYFHKVQYMLYPRIFAVAEVAWGTSNPAAYDEFKERVTQQVKYLDEKGIYYGKAFLRE